MTLAWIEPESDGGSAVGYYEYEVDGFRTWTPTPDSSTFVVITGLDADMAAGYTYRVRAVNSNGAGPAVGSDGTGGTTPPRTTDPPTGGEILSITISGAEEKDIDGDRWHLDEGEHTRVTVTIEWEDEQLEKLWADGKPDDVVVMLDADPVTDNPRWLSPAEIDHDVNIGPGFVIEVEVPKVPASARAAKNSGSTQFTLGRDDDAEAEAFMLVVTNIADFHASSEEESEIFVIEDAQTQGITLERVGSGYIFEGGDDVEFEVTASPSRVDLDLEVRFDLDDVTGETVASRDNRLDVSGATIGVGPDAEETVTVTLDGNDDNRVNDKLRLTAEVVPYALDTGAFEGIGSKELEFDVIDVHKLPPLTVAPAEGTVMEGSSIMLTVSINRNPPSTIATADAETREYTSEPVEVMLMANMMSTAGEDDYTLPGMVMFEKHDGTAPWVQTMMVEVMATMDDDIDEDHMLYVDAEVDGMSDYGPNTDMDMYPSASVLTIMDETPILVWANPANVIEKVIYDAKAAGAGDDMMFMMGEMIEVDPRLLFDQADMAGLTIEYAATSDDEMVASASEENNMVMVKAVSSMGGMAHVTITATAILPSGAKALPQTEPNVAQVIFPVEVAAAVPALPIIAQLLLAAFLAMGGYRRYLRR